MVVENIIFTTDNIRRSNKSGRRVILNAVYSGEYRVTSDFCTAKRMSAVLMMEWPVILLTKALTRIKA
jgi:hypothetical protein